MRFPAFVLRLALGVGLTLTGPSGCGGKPPAPRPPERFEGVFEAQGPQGRIQLTLAEVGDEVRVTSLGETSIGRRTGPNRVEGRQMQPEGDSSFVLAFRDGKLVVRWTVTTPEGGKVELPDVLLERVKQPPGGAGGAGGGGAGASSDLARDDRLVGDWRATEVAEDATSPAKVTHLRLAAEGTYETWQITGAGASESETPRRAGEWRAADAVLWFRSEGDTTSGVGGWREVGRYALSDRALTLDSAGRVLVFERL